MKEIAEKAKKSPELFRYGLLFAVIYFVQGTGTPSSGLAAQPISYLLKETMMLSAAASAGFLALMSIAWTIKPVYGLLSDFVPIFGYRRKSYLLIANAFSVIAWVSLAFLGSYAYSPVLIILIFCALGFAVSDVICDALMVQIGKPLEMTGRFQAIQWGSIMLASVLSGIGGGWIAENLSYRNCFLIASFFPLLTIVTTIFVVREEKVKTNKEQMNEVWLAVKKAAKTPRLWAVVGFLFAWNFSPGFGTPLFYFMRDNLKFSKIFIGSLDSVSSASGIVGAFLFWKFCKNIRIKRLLVAAIVIGVAGTLAYLGLVGEVTAVMLSITVGMVSMVAHLAILDLSAKACPEWAEGTVFAALMSVMNLGSMGSRFIGGWLYDALGIRPLIVISALFTAGCFLLIPTLKLTEGEPIAE